MREVPVVNCNKRDCRKSQRGCSGVRLSLSYLSFRRPGLDNLPEPLNNLVRWVTAIDEHTAFVGAKSLFHLLAAIVGMLLPVIHIDLGHSANEKLLLLATMEVEYEDTPRAPSHQTH